MQTRSSKSTEICLADQKSQLNISQFKVLELSATELSLWQQSESFYDKLLDRLREKIKIIVEIDLSDINSYTHDDYVENSEKLRLYILKHLGSENISETTMIFSNLVKLNPSWRYIEILIKIRNTWCLGIKEARAAAWGLPMPAPISTKHEVSHPDHRTNKLLFPRPEIDVFINYIDKVYNLTNLVMYHHEKPFLYNFLNKFPNNIKVNYDHFYKELIELEDRIREHDKKYWFSIPFELFCKKVSELKSEMDYYQQTKACPHRLFTHKAKNMDTVVCVANHAPLDLNDISRPTMILLV